MSNMVLLLFKLIKSHLDQHFAHGMKQSIHLFEKLVGLLLDHFIYSGCSLHSPQMFLRQSLFQEVMCYGLKEYDCSFLLPTMRTLISLILENKIRSWTLILLVAKNGYLLLIRYENVCLK